MNGASGRAAASGAGGTLRAMVLWGSRLALLGVAVFALTFAAVCFMQGWQYEVHGAARPIVPPVDAVIVLGGGMDPDGELNIIGRGRVRTAVALLERGEAGRAIFTGFGCSGGNDACSEAASMRARALAEGADPARLVVEPDARTTLENLHLSFAIADARGLARLAVLTDAFHLTRVAALARLLGRDAVPVAAEGGLYLLPWHEQVPLLTRETLAWWYNLGKAAAWEGLGLLGWSEAERGQALR